MKLRLDWSLVALLLAAVLFIGGQWKSTDRQGDLQRVVESTARQAHANCVVVSVLLTNRADRDATLKLFEPIRRENPAQFDKLVKRAEEGDKRLARVQGDLACAVIRGDTHEPHPGRY